jgi:dihydroorotase
MENHWLIKNARVVNEGTISVTDVLIKNGYIEKIAPNINTPANASEINAEGLYLLPGLIDDQVHFREPGLTHKGSIATESAAAVAGGITSFMEMPNTNPQTTTNQKLQEKFDIAKGVSPANFSFFFGATNDNLEEVLRVNPKQVCGVKVFMGSSTGNMLVDNFNTLENLFSNCEMLIATHCEDEQTIKENLAQAQAKFGLEIPMHYHPIIRDNRACLLSSSMAVSLARKHNTRLHILHISTAEETQLFQNNIPLSQKRITSEACTHHLWFTQNDYEKKGSFIKWNPAVKSAADRKAIRDAVNQNKIDVIATDHAPHTLEEKNKGYLEAPSGGPLVQHTLQALFELHKQGVFTLETIVEKTAHAVADIFKIEKRGYIREGYYADLVLLNPNQQETVNKNNILYKCGWSPFEGETFSSSVTATFVNGNLVYNKLNKTNSNAKGMQLLFNK